VVATVGKALRDEPVINALVAETEVPICIFAGTRDDAIDTMDTAPRLAALLYEGGSAAARRSRSPGSVSTLTPRAALRHGLPRTR
jgi:hypothetical protein